MYKVIKRDGKVTDFDIAKITIAITQAFESVQRQYHPSVIDMLALRVTSDFEPKIKEERIHVEDIQDSVEDVLIQADYADVAKSYILYRKQREKIRNMRSTILDYKDLVDSYVKATDWRVKENSTVTYSVGGLILNNSGAITANYWLSEIYDDEIANAHKNGDLHIHDLSMLTGYCAGWSLKQLIQEGLGGVVGKITSKPASHLATLCNQMVNFLGIMQNEWAGAQAFSSFDTYLAPFVKVDNLDYDQVKKCVESFIYGAAYLMEDHIPYEFRTTIVKELHTLADVQEIGKWLKDARAYYLQGFVDSERVIQKGLHAYDAQTMKQLQEAVIPYIANTQLRGL